jgi:S-DNA-T family DNA segregation ATPase FtsK/SpoIIIE
MQLVLEGAGQLRDIDVNVQVPDATIADLLDALGDRATAGARGIVVNGQFLRGNLGLAQAGLHDGAVVRLVAGPSSRPSATVSGGPALAVVAGVDAGHRSSVWPGRTMVIGRDAGCHIVLSGSSVSARHCAVDIDHLGRVIVQDLQSHNGTWIDDEPVREPRILPPGATLRLGAVHLTLSDREPDDRSVVHELARQHGTSGSVAFNRPPRSAPTPEPPPLKLPAPPREDSSKQPFSWISLLIPVALGSVMALALGPVYALFMLLSPAMMIGNWVEGRRTGKKVSQAESARFAQGLDAFRDELTQRQAMATARARVSRPDPSEVLRRASGPSVLLWERRRGDADFLQLSAGIGSVPWQPKVESSEAERPEQVLDALAQAGTLDRVPAAVDLADGGVVGIAGNRAAALALARSLVCQAAVHHGPADLRIAVLTDPDETSCWEWTKWLPHTSDLDAGGGARLLAGSRDESDALLKGLLDAGRERKARQEPDAEANTEPVLLAVVDAVGLTEGRNSPARAVLRGDAGPVAGIVLASTADRLPAVCSTVIQVVGEFGDANLACPQRGETVDGLLTSGVSVATARSCALALARFEDPEVAVAGASLPSRVDLTALFHEHIFDAEVVGRRWRAEERDHGLLAPVGVTEDGVFTLDLVRDGPHGLMGGTTGSGKSELLRSLVAALALGADPLHLNFVLIDYKGGSAFDECARLPHTVGLVTDLDPQLGERALRCLEAELHYRERLLRAAGATDLPEYLRLPAAEETPLPRLVVIVDEFATMAAELPEFMEALVGIAQRGRSLGVHMLLATQRPSGAIKDNIRANTNLRIALRVQDIEDSIDVIGVRNAAYIGRGQPGRGYVRLGPGEVVPIQTALVTGVSGGKDDRRVDVADFAFGRVARPPEAPKRVLELDETSDLVRVVTAARTAFEAMDAPEPRRPWPEPLPTTLPLDSVSSPAAPGTALVALADDPEAQSQYPVGWDMAKGNLLLYGLVGSGTTTTLASLALSLAAHAAPDDLHMYVLDFGAGGLAPLDGLPHVGAVIAASESERQQRLIRWLRGELDRRREAGPGDDPRIVLMLDGYSAFRAEYEDLAVDWVQDYLARLIGEGPSVGIFTIVTVARVSAVPSALSSIVSQKWVFHLPDPQDYSLFGLRYQSVGELPTGRAVIARTGQHVQIGLPTPSLAEAVSIRAAASPKANRKLVTLSTLPSRVDPAELCSEMKLDEQLWEIPVGITESALEPALLRVYPGEHVLVGGPPRSGRSGLLRAIAALFTATAPEVTLTVVATRPSPLRMLDVSRLITAADQLPDALTAVSEAGGRQVILIDDADSLDDPDDAIVNLLKQNLTDVHLVVAGRADTLRSAYGHWTQQVRRSRSGVLLRPDIDMDGDLLGVRLPRRTPVPITIARGWLANDGAAELIQAATIG